MTEPPEHQSIEWPEDQSSVLTEAHYAAIGRVAAEWASFEVTVDTASLNMADMDAKTAACFTAQIQGSARKLDAYIALARLRGATKTIEELNKFAKDTQGLQEQRNRIVHDPWVGFTKPHRLEATARKLLRLMFIPVPTDEVLQLAPRIVEHENRFNELNARVIVDARTSSLDRLR